MGVAYFSRLKPFASAFVALGVAIAGLTLVCGFGSDADAFSLFSARDLDGIFTGLTLPAKLRCGIVNGHFTCWNTKKHNEGTTPNNTGTPSTKTGGAELTGIDPSPSSADYTTCHDPEAKSFPDKGCLKAHDSSALPEYKAAEYKTTCKSKSGIPLCGPVPSRNNQFECWCYYGAVGTQ
jgi:hypothetical protein